MKILQLHNHQSGTGGALHVLEEDAALLSAAGHDVDQLFEPAAEDSSMSAIAMGLSAVWNRRACHDLEQKIKSFRPDVVHVHTPFPLQSPAVFRVAHSAGCATVTTVHAYRYSCVAGLCFRSGAPCEDCVGSRLKLAGVRHRCYHDSLGGSTALTLSLIGHRAIGTFSHRIDRYLALTEFSRDLLIRDGFPAEKITVKPNSVPDPGLPRPGREREGFALHVGRLVPEKGIETLLAAWRSVPSGRDLYIAGDGPLRHLVDQAAQANPHIHALGWCDAETLNDLHSRASICITPSEWYEGGPLVVLQSMAAGTPQLLSDLRNLSESVVANGAGRTFPAGDAAGLAAVATEMLDDAPALELMGVRARELYESRHTPALSLKTLESVYESVLDRSASRDRAPGANR